MNQKVSEIFKSNKIKNTIQRQRVYEYLITCKEPITADNLYIELSKDKSFNDVINMSTIYRILELFVKHNLVLKNSFGNDHRATFEINLREHKHHLICVECNKITAIKGCPLKTYEKDLGDLTHFKILEHRLEIFGVCPNCQSGKNDHH